MTTKTRLVTVGALAALALAPAGSAFAAAGSHASGAAAGHASVSSQHAAQHSADKHKPKVKKPKVVKSHVSGTLTVVDAAAGALSVSRSGGHSTTVTVSFGTDADTVVKRDDVRATLADLVVGDHVSAKLVKVGDVVTATKVNAEAAETEAEEPADD